MTDQTSDVSKEEYELMLSHEPRTRYCTGGFTREQYAEFCGEELPEGDPLAGEKYRARKAAACLGELC